ncbi:MAG: Hsp20/alpha crystallin family protein [Cyclonatronaceae bacterium]
MPDSPFNKLEDRLNQLGEDLNSFIGKIVPEAKSTGGYRPHADMVEGNDSYKLHIDLPGLTKSDIGLKVQDRILTVNGERQINTGKDEMFLRKERSSGAFTRSFPLPEDASSEEIKAKFSNGVLTVTMKRTETDIDSASIKIE